MTNPATLLNLTQVTLFEWVVLNDLKLESSSDVVKCVTEIRVYVDREQI